MPLPPGGHYFSTSPAPPTAPRTVSLVLPDLTVDLVADAGVFSASAVDPGTRFLLQAGPPVSPGARHILDLGCGYGPVAVALARRNPEAQVWAVDVNERAVACCRENAARLGLDNVSVGLVTDDDPDGGVPVGVTFDAIRSNPPIRVGKTVLHPLLLRWLERLASPGDAVLVVQKHLGADSLQRWLTTQGWPTERLASRSGYRLLGIRRAP